jgi:predicted MPP superfamily phosphohydrolase
MDPPATVVVGGIECVGGLGYSTCCIEPHWIEWVRRDLPVTGLPESLQGSPLIQLSDLHVGPHVDDDYIRHTLAQVAAIEPDFVVYTGDFMTSAGAERLSQVGRTLAELPRGPAIALCHNP